jgi:tRNA(adenine34) deaminase
MTSDQAMQAAIEQALAAQAIGEVPIGAVVIHDPTGQIVGAGYNRRIVDRDPTAHAEILALREAGKAIGEWRLLDCTLVVTLEPCPMCAGAAWAARVPLIVFGADDPKGGAAGTLYNFAADPRLNHETEVVRGVRAAECSALLRDFFAARR